MYVIMSLFWSSVNSSSICICLLCFHSFCTVPKLLHSPVSWILQLRSPMSFKVPPSTPLAYLSLFLCFFAISCLSDPRATQVARICTNTTAAASGQQLFVSNFVAAVNSMTKQISSQKFGSIHIGTGNNTVYALGECMRDLSTEDCNLCFAQCKIQILRCFPFQLGTRGGRIFFDGYLLTLIIILLLNDWSTSLQSLLFETAHICFFHIKTWVKY